MKVAEWISFDRASTLTESFGGLGGWFGASSKGFDAAHTWQDYLARWKTDTHPRAEALRESIVANRIWECGDWHQDDDNGVPMFDDGTVATFSFRGWGDLLAAVWTEQLGRQYCYMDFYYINTPRKPEDFGVRAAKGVAR